LNYALIVGIEEYYQLSSTLYADNDAEKFNEILLNTMDFETKILINSDATFLNINVQFQKIIDKIKEGDKFYFFFAGHGININGKPRITCFDTYNHNTEDLENTTISIESMLGKIEHRKCNQSIFFIDACESTISFEGRSLRSSKLSLDDLEQLQKKSEYTYVYSAAAVNGVASVMEDGKIKNGIFTHFLLKAFSGEVEKALNEHKKLTSTSLSNYLTYEIDNYCSNISHKQVAYSWGKSQNEFLIFDFSNKKSKEKPLNINDIYFGVIDADNEYTKDIEAFKNNYYDLNKTAEKIIEDRTKFIVLGKKGTGKTYIGKFLEIESEITKNVKTKYVNFQSFDYIKFDGIKDTQADSYEKYSIGWEWIICMHVSKLIIDKLSTEKNAENDEALESLKLLYTDLLGEGNPTFRKLIKSNLKRGIEINPELEKYIGKNYRKKNSHYKLQDIVELIFVLFSKINFIKDSQYLLVLDGLDEKIKNDEKYKDSLNGLLWTASRLNNEFNDDNLPIKVVIFLRNNVYEFVSGANVNKLNFANTLQLTWNSDLQNKYNFPLADFINRRISNSLAYEISRDENPLKLILPFEVEFKNKNKYSQKDAWGWILDFTTYKPRDVIQFFNSCQKLCEDNNQTLDAKILWAALKEYSGYLVREFKDELFGFYTDEQIKELFNTILPKMGKSKKSFIEMKTLINRSTYCNDLKSEDLLNNLYSIGLLGVFESDFAHWSYRTKTLKFFAPENCKYQLHSGVWKALAIW